jgi:hypothetical protein
MTSHWIKFTAIFIVASALLFSGFLLAWYPSSRIETLEMYLDQSGLTQAEIDNLESSLSWWSNQGVYTYGSVANFVLLGGFLVLVYAIVYSITSVWRESIKAKLTLEEKRYVSGGEPERQEPINYQYEQTRKAKTGFPIAAGILTIITSSIIMAFSGIFIVGGVGSILTTVHGYSSQDVNLLGDGLLGVLVFGFALAAGIMILKRKNFVFSIIGLCFMLVKGTTFILVTGELVGVALGIVILAISILSLIFTSISYKEFS